jgi:hypothetical protein
VAGGAPWQKRTARISKITLEGIVDKICPGYYKPGLDGMIFANNEQTISFRCHSEPSLLAAKMQRMRKTNITEGTTVSRRI